MEGSNGFFPILLTSCASHSDHFSFQKSVPVCHAFLSCIQLLHFCCAIQGGIKMKYKYIQSNGDEKSGQKYCVQRT